MIGAFLVARLASLLDGRVTPVRPAPDSRLPALAYQVISETRPEGSVARGLVRSVVQLSVIGDDYDQAYALARSVRAALHRFRGAAGGIEVRGVFETGRNDDAAGYAPALVAMTWRIHWREASDTDRSLDAGD